MEKPFLDESMHVLLKTHTHEKSEFEPVAAPA